ncbi:TetR/AcrR family transcriptional regulator [Herbiconiux sp.]|uniref:TetR/AcrR family transcriptional regulator n=1 Tax=Herbiconiux sp. TaxID=1871186 RepID=UPI0025BCB905|nr:TetR/AcrR family transcriptional regulator [Herbiconiux sp.]
MVRQVRYGGGREALVEAAVEIVAAKGLRGLTFRAVAAQAGVNNSLVAHHFGTRDALLAAALEWAVERSIDTTLLLDFESEQRFTNALLESLVVAPGIQVFQYEMILEARRNPLFALPVKRLYERYFDVTRESLRRHVPDGDLDAVARHVFSALEGFVLQYLAGVEEDSIRAGLHALWAVIVDRSSTTKA